MKHSTEGFKDKVEETFNIGEKRDRDIGNGNR